jgi:hypothetical protein
MAATPVQLTKLELLERLQRRVSDRYGVSVDQQWLNDLIKAGLITKAQRAGNVGRTPVFLHDAPDYRRALQIARLKSRGTVGRDAIRINLFINRYSLPTHDIRYALYNEWGRQVRALMAPVRSGYLDKSTPIPPKHRASFLAQIGPPDDVITHAGLILEPDQVIDGLRQARDPRFDDVQQVSLPSLWVLFFEGRSFGYLASRFTPTIAGLLVLPEVDDRFAARDDPLAKLIFSTPDEDFEKARWLALQFQRRGASMLRLFGHCAGKAPTQALDRAIHHSIQRHPAWASVFLIMGLSMLSRFPLPVSISQLDRISKFFDRLLQHSPEHLVSRFTNSSYFRSIES